MTTRTTGLLLVVAAVILFSIAASGCAMPRRTPNPSFPTTKEEAQADLDRMTANPLPLERPLVVLAGIGDPKISSGALIRGLAPCVTGTIVELSFFNEFTFEGCRQKLLREVAAALDVDPDHLPEVDVVAFSMGGLIARDAAIPDRAARQLPIRRLYTISAPHEGARLAGIPMGLPQGEDMTPGSEFMERLRVAPRTYELVCYARLDDITVGEEFAAPYGEPLWWVPTPSGEWSHMAAFSDPRIIADIARRLRGERSLTRPPAAPLPL
ncbi:MAG: hypothetical protein RLY21_2772 [Planctomycetota bacterium]